MALVGNPGFVADSIQTPLDLVVVPHGLLALVSPIPDVLFTAKRLRVLTRVLCFAVSRVRKWQQIIFSKHSRRSVSHRGSGKPKSGGSAEPPKIWR